MIYNSFKDKNLSLLGFGTMRLPTLPTEKIDEKQTAEMVDCAIKHGVNYFDTAYPYHGGMSEIVIGKILKNYPRDSYFLADKYPGHQISDTYDPAAIFEEQLKKCGVDYFDFYLLHNVYENSIGVYTDERWGIIDYFVEQKRLGRIKHLGFSSHGRPDNLIAFLDLHGDKMEFCQIQLNYLDWTLQNAKAKYEILTERGIPVWVMEPVRGGRLARLTEEEGARLRELRPDKSPAAWAFNWLQTLPNVKMILSGMSDLSQMKENIETFSGDKALSDGEISLLCELAEGMKNAIPCTACRYCSAGCPMGLDIPVLIHGYNDFRFGGGITVPMQLDALPEDKRPSACIGCGACSAVCPQKIDIPSAMKEFSELLSKAPKWSDLCRIRAEEAKKAAQNS